MKLHWLAIPALLLSSVPAFSQVYVRIAPPPPRAEFIGRAPGPGFFWTDGYWAWNGRGYYWIPGRWISAPRYRSAWVPGRWHSAPRGYYWRPGYWR
jgi:hypothetical protein